jgi:hypothetical protein
MNNEGTSILSRVFWLLFVSAFALLLLVAIDPQYHKEANVYGSIVGNIQQVGEGKNPEEYVQVKLQNGVLVNAIISPTSGFPYKIGTPVLVTPYRSMLFGKSTYRAYVDSALTTQ